MNGLQKWVQKAKKKKAKSDNGAGSKKGESKAGEVSLVAQQSGTAGNQSVPAGQRGKAGNGAVPPKQSGKAGIQSSRAEQAARTSPQQVLFASCFSHLVALFKLLWLLQFHS